MFILLFVSSLLVTLGAYSLCRFQFLFWNWDFYHQQPIGDLIAAFLWALRFDLSAIAILSAIPFLVFWLLSFLVPQKNLGLGTKRAWLALVVIFQLPTMIINLGDAEFIHFLGRRYTFDALFFFREIPGKFWSLTFTYWKLNLIDLVILGFYVWAMMIWAPKMFAKARQWSWKKNLGFGFVVFVALGIAARGGLQSKPINFAHAQIFTQPMMNSLVLNSSFTLIQTMKRDSLPRDRYFSEEEMLKWLRYGEDQKALLPKLDLPAKPNIVLVIVESFGLEYMGRPHGGQGYTPFLDELSKKGLFFPNTFANARRSIEGIGAILGGIPALMNEPFLSSQYLTNYFQGAGTLLQKQGYHTSFFHGAQNGTMYFDQFMKSAGVQHYFGKNEYGNPADDDGVWGIWDEPFLQWMSGKLSTFPQPFFSTVFTLSSHHPFQIPKQYEGKFPKGPSEIHETIGYTDFALQKFFETAAKEPWFQNTIFLITADHTFKPNRAEYQNDLGQYRIPLIIYSPGWKLPKVDESQIVQQIDILPTLMEFTKVETKERNFLGTSIFTPGDRFAVNYSDQRYLFVLKDYFLTYERGRDFHMYAAKDVFEKQDLAEPAERKMELENRLKAVIQYFSQGMWDNKLYYPSGR